MQMAGADMAVPLEGVPAPQAPHEGVAQSHPRALPAPARLTKTAEVLQSLGKTGTTLGVNHFTYKFTFIP